MDPTLRNHAMLTSVAVSLALGVAFPGQAATALDFGTWSAATTFPTDGYQYDVVEHNGYIYIAGGYNGVSFDAVYFARTNPDGSLGPWNPTTPMPEADQGPGVTVWNGHIYAALHNGHVYQAALNPDGTVETWQSEAMADVRRGGRLGTEAYDGYLYIFGGWDGGSNMFADVYVASIDGDGSLGPWTTTTAMPQGRQHLSVHFYNNRVYIAGGITSGLSILDSAYSAPVNADGTLGAWRQEADLPSTLWYHNSLLTDSSIYLLGGRTGYSGGEVFAICKGVIETDGTIATWTDIGDIPGAFPLAMGTVYVPAVRQAYLIGGGQDGGSLTNEVWTNGCTHLNLPLDLITLLPADGCTDVTLHPDGSRLYVRHSVSGTFAKWRVYETAEPYALLGECDAPSLPWTSDISADGTTLWMSVYYGGKVRALEVDPLSCTQQAELDVGSWTDAVLFDDAHRYLFVGENDPGTGAIGTIQIVDTVSPGSAAVVATVPLNGEPGRLNKALGDPFMYTITRNAGTERLYRISTQTHAVEGTCELFNLGLAGFSVALDGSSIYVASPDDNAVYTVEPPTTIDSGACQILDVLSMVSPAGAFVDPSGSYLVVPQPVLEQISIVCLASGAVLNSISVPTMTAGRFPAVWAPDERTVFVPAGNAGVAVLSAGVPSDCGNGVVDPGEVCDDGFTDGCGTCNATCTGAGTGSVCGDGVFCPETEACDDSYTDDCGTCNSTCTSAGTGSICGDCVVCPEFESCDDCFTDPCGTCDATCTGAGTGSTCGDGVECPETEVCDDGFSDDCGMCDATCTGPGAGSTCGDGVVCPEMEACDDGFADDCGTCDTACTGSGTGSCGDGFLCPETETCDDGNLDDDDGCSSICAVEPECKCSDEPNELSMCACRPVPAPSPHEILKNRYISIDPHGASGGNFGKDLDIRLTLTSTLVNGVTAIGSQWWANSPDADCIAIVGPNRPLTPPNWDACPTLHLTGCPIIPTSTYDIVAINGETKSEPLSADTQAKPGVNWHGDCVGFFTGTEWTAPNGVTSIDDAVAAIKTFQNPSATPGCGDPPCNATHTSVTDVEPNLTPGPQINSVVNIGDVFSIIRGFQGFEYPGPQIELCPDS